MSKQTVLGICLVLVLVACGGTRPSIGADAGPRDTGTTPPGDSGPPNDTGTTGPRDTGGTGDPCASDDTGAAAGAGCNGGFQSATPAPNAPSGTCTGDASGQGTCMAAGICTAEPDMPGFCLSSCTAGPTYVSTGGCPTGFRCFDLDMDLCFRDCDPTHACPAGMMCDVEGSCVPM